MITRSHQLLYLIPILLTLTLALLSPCSPAQTSGPPPLLKVRTSYQQREELARLPWCQADTPCTSKDRARESIGGQ